MFMQSNPYGYRQQPQPRLNYPTGAPPATSNQYYEEPRPGPSGANQCPSGSTVYNGQSGFGNQGRFPQSNPAVLEPSFDFNPAVSQEFSKPGTNYPVQKTPQVMSQSQSNVLTEKKDNQLNVENTVLKTEVKEGSDSEFGFPEFLTPGDISDEFRQKYFGHNGPPANNFEEYMKSRKLSPAAYMGAEAINSGSGLLKANDQQYPPNIQYEDEKLEYIENIDVNAPIESFHEMLKKVIMRNQYKPSKEEYEDTLTAPPLQPEQLSDAWIHIHYYELTSRLGPIYKSNNPTVTIDGFCAPPDSTRFCLGAIGNPSRDAVAVAVRRQIGKGWRIILNGGGNITLFSLGEAPVFVQCPIQAKMRGDHLSTIYRLAGGHSMTLFDEKVFMQSLEEARATNNYDNIYALKNLCYVRMSFVKGWGEKYRRRAITQTPCWAEAHWVQMLHKVDEVLQNVDHPGRIGHSDS